MQRYDFFDGITCVTGTPTDDGEYVKADFALKMFKALQKISSLWPEPPNCADIMSVSGINDGRSRAIIADAAIMIARSTLAEAKP